MIVNANRLQIHVLAYSLFNWFRRLALAADMRKMRIDTIRLKLLKVAAKVVRSARYKYFKLCSSCPYKKEFYETLANIQVYGYVRCSSIDQNEDRQMIALREAVVPEKNFSWISSQARILTARTIKSG